MSILYTVLLMSVMVVILISAQFVILKYYILPKIILKTEILHKTLHPDLTQLVKLMESMIKRLVTIHINIKNYVINTTGLRSKLTVVVDALPYRTSKILDAKFMVALRLMTDVVVNLFVDSKTNKTKSISAKNVDSTVKSVLNIINFTGVATPKLSESLEFSIRVSISTLRLAEVEQTVDSVAEVYTELFKEFYEEFTSEYVSGKFNRQPPSKDSIKRSKLHELVSKNKYVEAIENLKQFEDVPDKVITLLYSRHAYILEKINEGTISSDSENLELTKLRLAILNATHFIQ